MLIFLLPDVEYTAYISGPQNYEITFSSNIGEATKSLYISEAGSYSYKFRYYFIYLESENENNL